MKLALPMTLLLTCVVEDRIHKNMVSFSVSKKAQNRYHLVAKDPSSQILEMKDLQLHQDPEDKKTYILMDKYQMQMPLSFEYDKKTKKYEVWAELKHCEEQEDRQICHAILGENLKCEGQTDPRKW